MRRQLAIALICAPALSGCTSGTYGLDWFRSYEIEGNSTGGVIPPQLVKGDVQAAADKFCDKWDRVAKITFNSGQPGSSVVFICVDKVKAEPPPPPPLDEPIAAATEIQPLLKQLPPRIDLAYRGFLGTRGFFIGDAVYRLEHSANQYKISTVGEARGLAALLFRGQGKATSEGAITASGLQPNTYSIERTNNYRRESATFDWETGMVILNDDKALPLELPTFDPLAVIWQFYFAPPGQEDAEFNIATTRKIYHYIFHRIGNETVTLPFGDVETQIWRR